MAEEAQPNQVRENEPADLGYAAPDTGQGEGVESEVPEGVDALTEEQKQAAEERGGGGDEGDDDGGALDVSEIMAEGGDDAEASAEDDADDDDADDADADDTDDDA